MNLHIALRRLTAPGGAHTEAEHWKSDNRGLFEESYLAVRHVSIPPEVLTLAAVIVRTALETGTTPDAEAICAAVGPYDLTEAGLAALPTALIQGFLIAAAEHDTDTNALQVSCTALRCLLTDRRLGRRILESGILHRLLLQDPIGVYPAMHERSQAEYRACLARLAKRRSLPEREAAERVLALASASTDPAARHVGYWILRRPIGEKPAAPARLYTALHLGLTLVSAGAFSLLSGPWALLTLPSLAGAWEGLLARVFRRFLPIRPLPRMKESREPALCVITCLCSGAEKVPRLLQRLEDIALSGSRNASVRFGLLADLPEADTSETEADAAVLQALKDGIDALNIRSDREYCLFTRPRSFYPSDGRWMPEERKRGAIDALIRLLAGEPSPLAVHGVPASSLVGIPRIITLDEDTRPDVGALDRLLETAEHPLNQPVVADGAVQAGYGILQPGLVTSLESAAASHFAALLAGGAGFDRYADGAGEWQTDLTGTCAFTGKGLLDVGAYMAVLRDRLPKGVVLSHDLPEGELLRTACVTAASFSESFPKDASSYFGRLHRWQRGDVQNLRLLRDPGLRRAAGRRILENAGRLLLPVFQLISLLCAVFCPWLLPLTLLSLFLPAILRLPQAIPNPCRLTRLHTIRYAGPGGEWLRSLLRLSLLPADARSALDAGIRSLTRLWLTHRGLLEWTAFSDSTARRSPVPTVSLLAGTAGVLLYLSHPGFPSVLLPFLSWLLAPLFLQRLGRRNVSRETFSESAAPTLLKDAAAMLSYYTEHCTPENHWLPPDNVQEQPGPIVTRRTSPTNIGLCMLSLWEGVLLGLLPQAETLELLSHIADSIEAIPRWHGHLPNWIDLVKLQPLKPRWFSTADEGNLAVCLFALAQALPKGLLRDRLRDLAESMDFSALYDPEAELLYIGYDLELDRPSQSHYDLMASEARLASYVGIALGQLPPEHWQALSRVLCVTHREGGMASWGGTAFEYLLPQLFLPTVPGSLWDETLQHAVQAQRADALRGIWGKSESGYFAFDAELLYQYKAHGATSLARSAAAGEPVFAPYAAYLALPLCSGSVMELLRRYDGLQMRGRYGYYEAIDFDPRRSPAGMPVRSWMAHHIGMSILSIAHLLTDAEPRRLLWQDPRFRAFEPLLAERIPYGAEAPRQPREVLCASSGKPERYREDFDRMDALVPRILTLGQPGFWVLLTDAGGCVCQAGRVSVTGLASGGTLVGGPRWALQYGEQRIPLTFGPDFSDSYHYETEFQGDCAAYHVRTPLLHAQLEVRAAAGSAAVQWRVAVESAMTCTAVLELQFVPILERLRDHLAHPAFSRLFLHGFADETHAVLRRIRRGSGTEAALAFGGTVPAQYTLARPDRQGQTAVESGYVLDCEVHMRCPIRLSPEAPFSCRFALGYGADPASAEAAMREGLALEAHQAAYRMDEAAQALEMEARDVASAMDLYGETLFVTSNRRRMANFLENCREGRAALWRVGISGDFPVLAIRVPDEHSVERLYALLRAHVYLFSCGLILDCAIFLSDGGSYRRPIYTRARELLDLLDGSNLLDVPGGVHLIDAEALSEEQCTALIANSAVYVDCGQGGFSPPERRMRSLLPKQDPVEAPPVSGAFGDRCYRFSGRPPVAWSHVLANRSFGYLATDAGIGFCWHRNARENKLNAWQNDPYAADGPERIEWESGGTRFSAFSENGDARVTYGMGYARWEKVRDCRRFSVTAFVHPHLPVRLLLFGTDAPDAVIRYRTTLQLGPDPGAAATMVTWRDEDGHLLARNAASADYPHTRAALCCHPQPARFTCDARAAAEWQLNGETGGGYAPCFAAEVPMERHGEGYCAVIALGCPANAAALAQIDALTDPETAWAALEETRRYWDKLTDSGSFAGATAEMQRYLNGFALYQTIACRLWGRTSLWQNGGAYGFRDQLQDVLALLAAPPDPERYALARAQILRAAAHQYTEGDVQHWWHPREGASRGVRTRISDDLLFLPWLLTRYMRVVRDDLPDIRVPYLESPPLRSDEHDRYEEAPRGRIRESIYRHCVRALELVPQRGTGPHGLLRMGGGDWNDGMDAVRGESVWLTWFAAMVYRDFAELAERRGDADFALRCRDYAAGLCAAAERSFRGDHYLRGWYTDGTPLGSDDGDACRLDAIAQAFAALAGGDRAHVRTALKEAYARLFDREHRLVRLFDPPFTQESRENPGYIKAYPPGTRENGGQYTHGAIWLAWGLYEAGLYEEADSIMAALCPTDRDTAVYRAEPYALCADVYAAPAPAGQGGWSLYTGAAAWYYTVARTWLQKPGHEKASDLI